MSNVTISLDPTRFVTAKRRLDRRRRELSDELAAIDAALESLEVAISKDREQRQAAQATASKPSTVATVMLRAIDPTRKPN